jgi:metal-responsive CopG/Arc/MetJ family transcriptional regulator
MIKMAEIQITSPEKISISVPQYLLDEFERMVDQRNLDAIIAEALMDELKRIRFRTDLRRVSNGTGVSTPWSTAGGV